MSKNAIFENGQPPRVEPVEQYVLDMQAAEEALAPQKAILAAIAALEAQVTNRRLREAALTDEGKAWLQNIENQITAERAKL